MASCTILRFPNLGRAGGCRRVGASSVPLRCMSSGRMCRPHYGCDAISSSATLFGAFSRSSYALSSSSYDGERTRKGFPSGIAAARKFFGENEKSARRVIPSRSATRRDYYNAPQKETIPLWLLIIEYIYDTVTYGLVFLWEQPGQLRHIEWPSFQSTISMAMLTLVVVALLIVFLATIDSTFSFLLSGILRRTS